MYFKSLLENGRPKGTPDRIALPVAGDPLEARAKVLRLVDDLGFDPVDAGGIEESWRQQPGTPCYTRRELAFFEHLIERMNKAELGLTLGGIGEAQVSEHVSGAASDRFPPFSVLA